MRSVVQRVDRAQIRIGERTISGIERGLLVLVGIQREDQKGDADYLCEKIVNLRIFDDESGKMNLSLTDIQGEMLIVSQFTLSGDCRKGRRPSFTDAEDPHKARILYEYFVSQSEEKVGKVAQGEFQAMMIVELVNNGPVTILLDSRRKF